MSIRRDEVNLILTVNGQQSARTLQEMQAQARNLRRLLDKIPVDTTEFKEAAAKLKELDTRMKEVKSTMTATRTEATAFGGAATRVGGLWQRALAVFGGFSLAGIGLQVLDYGKKLFGISVSLDSLANKTRTVFGEAESLVRAFAEANAHSIGLARQDYINLATSVGDLLIPMGFSQETAAKLSVELVNMGGVLSEWTGAKVSAQEATEILNKALLGEREALNRLGIDIKDSLVQDELKRKGLSDLTGESRRQAEALVTLEQITQQSASATAAFAKNTDSLVRKKAELSASVSEVSQSLSKLLAPAFGFVLDVSNMFLQRLNSMSRGLSNLFQGNFSKAIDYFTTGFSMEDVAAEATKDKSAAEGIMEKAGSGLGTALGKGLDKEFDRLKKTGERGAKDIAEATKKRLQAALQAVDIEFAKEELAALKLKNDGIIRTETDFGNLMVSLQEQQLENRLAVYRRFGQEQTKEALELQKKLLEIQEGKNAGKPAVLAPLPGPALGTVTSQTAGAGVAGTLAGLSETEVLRDKFAALIDMEQQHELRVAEIRRNAATERLRMLQEANLFETEEYRKALAEKTKADEDFSKKKIENEQRTAELKRQIELSAMNATADLFGVAAELLAQDEKARKRNAAAIKAFQSAQVITNGILEVQKIWASVAGFGPAAPIIGGILTAVAVARTGIALAKINSAKFAGGGFTGDGIGLAPDSTGHRPVGVVHAHEWVSPPWMTQHPVYGAQIMALESVRQRGFADGGFATTPTVNVVPDAAAGSAQQISMEGVTMMANEFRGFRDEVRAWQGRIRVAYTDIRDVGNEVAVVEADAGI